MQNKLLLRQLEQLLQLRHQQKHKGEQMNWLAKTLLSKRNGSLKATVAGHLKIGIMAGPAAPGRDPPRWQPGRTTRAVAAEAPVRVATTREQTEAAAW